MLFSKNFYSLSSLFLVVSLKILLLSNSLISLSSSLLLFLSCFSKNSLWSNDLVFCPTVCSCSSIRAVMLLTMSALSSSLVSLDSYSQCCYSLAPGLPMCLKVSLLSNSSIAFEHVVSLSSTSYFLSTGLPTFLKISLLSNPLPFVKASSHVSLEQVAPVCSLRFRPVYAWFSTFLPLVKFLSLSGHFAPEHSLPQPLSSSLQLLHSCLVPFRAVC